MYADLNLQMLRNLKRGWLNFEEYNQPLGHSLLQIIICNIKTAMVDFNSKNFILSAKKMEKKKIILLWWCIYRYACQEQYRTIGTKYYICFYVDIYWVRKVLSLFYMCCFLSKCAWRRWNLRTFHRQFYFIGCGLDQTIGKVWLKIK